MNESTQVLLNRIRSDVSKLRIRSYNRATNPSSVCAEAVDEMHDRINGMIDELRSRYPATQRFATALARPKRTDFPLAG